MQIGKLDHTNLHNTRLDFMIDWYTNVPGMRTGHRPDFSFPGAWMYADWTIQAPKAGACIVQSAGQAACASIISRSELINLLLFQECE